MLLKKIAVYLILLSIGFIFIISAYFKLFPVEFFETELVDLGFTNWATALFLSRFIIGLEFLLGVVFVLNLDRKFFFLKLGSILLLIFNLHLIIQIYKYGFSGNCGCFGMEITMTPLQALIKNMFCLVGLWIVYKFHKPWTFTYQKAVLILLTLSLLILPFILNSPFENKSVYLEHTTPLDLNRLYTAIKTPKPADEIRLGKWLVAFVSLTCPHCKLATKKMGVMKRLNPSLPIYLIMNGEENLKASFLKENKAENIPHSMFYGSDGFSDLAGNNLPAIFWVENSKIVNQSKYYELNQKDIEDWIAKPIK